MEQGEVGYKSCLAKPNPDYLGLRIHAPQDLSDKARCLCDRKSQGVILNSEKIFVDRSVEG